MRNSKENMTRAAIKLLRETGLSGASVNRIVEASGSPKGSVYHHFPRGKLDWVDAALLAFGAEMRNGFAAAFGSGLPAAAKVQQLFDGTAKRLEANAFAQGCAVAAVVLDLDAEFAPLASTCEEIFRSWQEAIAEGLVDLDPADRLDVAGLVLATLEGCLILGRAQRSAEPIAKAGRTLARVLAGYQQHKD